MRAAPAIAVLGFACQTNQGALRALLQQLDAQMLHKGNVDREWDRLHGGDFGVAIAQGCLGLAAVVVVVAAAGRRATRSSSADMP